MQDFLERYQVIPFSKEPEKYIRYQASAVRQMLMDDFFEAKEQVPSPPKLTTRLSIKK